MEGRVGLGRRAKIEDIRFLRNHIAFEPLVSDTGSNERMLEKYRQLSSIFLDIIESKSNDWTDLLAKERRMQITTFHDAIPEIFEAIDRFQPPYRIALLGGKRTISLRNDPSQYALLVNFRGS